MLAKRMILKSRMLPVLIICSLAVLLSGDLALLAVMIYIPLLCNFMLCSYLRAYAKVYRVIPFKVDNMMKEASFAIVLTDVVALVVLVIRYIGYFGIRSVIIITIYELVCIGVTLVIVKRIVNKA